MHLLFTALHGQLGLKSFSFKTDQLEEGLDFINFVVAKGDTLVSVHLIDECSAIDLPLEAFDGKSFSTPIKNLEQDWLALLSKPVHRAPRAGHDPLEYLLKRIHNCETRMIRQLSMVSWFKALHKRAEETLTLEPDRSYLIDYYLSKIDFYRQRVVKSQTYYKQLSLQLNNLLEL
jgi:hypothetical protein